EGVLQFELRPAHLTMQPGQRGVSRLLVGPRRRNEARKGQRRAFAVRLKPAGGPEVYLRAATILSAPPRIIRPARWAPWLAAAAAASITDVRVGAGAGFDRLVIQFDKAIPVYQLQSNSGGTSFTPGAGGPPATVAGSFGMQLQINGLTAPDRYAHGTDLTQSF